MRVSEKAMEDAVKRICSFERTVRIPCARPEEAGKIVSRLRLDYPMAFHVRDIGYVYEKETETVCLTPVYSLTEEEYKQLTGLILENLGGIRKELLALESEEKKVQFIHDCLRDSVTYDDAGWRSHCIVGPLLDGRGAADGIAKAAQELFRMAGIRSHVITGTAKRAFAAEYERHAWNVVRISGKWRHLDIAFDGALGYGGCDYCNLSTDAIRNDHTVDEEFRAFSSRCTDPTDWFRENGLAFATLGEAERYIDACLRKNRKTVCFRMDLPADDELEDALSDYLRDAVRQYRSDCVATFSANRARNSFCIELRKDRRVAALLKAVHSTRREADEKRENK